MYNFSNSKKLNPEVIMFDMLGETFEANGDWNYRVYYEEYFEYLPSIFKNSAFGNYHVFQDNKVCNETHLSNSNIFRRQKTI